ncbi:MAG: hypothetical protein AB1546_12095 [bacterium]
MKRFYFLMLTILFLITAAGFAENSYQPKLLREINQFEGSDIFQKIHSVFVDENLDILIILNEAPLKISVFTLYDATPLNEIRIFDELKPPLTAASYQNFIYLMSSGNFYRFKQDGRKSKDFQPPPGLPAYADKLFFDRSGNFILLNRKDASVTKFNKDGKKLTEIRKDDEERIKKKEPPIGSIDDVHVDFTGTIYIADSKSRNIKKYNEKGEFAGVLGGDKDLTRIELLQSSLIAVDSHRNVWIYDKGDRKIKVLDSFGFYLGELQDTGKGDFRFVAPAMIYIDRLDRLYLQDEGSATMKVFDVRGMF